MQNVTYYLYQITNLINGKIYVGVHKTRDINDGYLGSGILIREAVLKYGKENFEKRILGTFSSEEEMYRGEAEVVTTEFINREDTYNLSEGGKLIGPTIRKHIGSIVGKLTFERGTGAFSPEAKAKAALINRERLTSPEGKLLQKKATLAAQEPGAVKKRKESYAKIKHQQGEKNSQYGKMRITDGVKNTSIPRDQPIPDGWRKGSVGKYKK